MIIVLTIYAVLALGLGFVGRRLGARAFVLGSLAPLATLGWASSQLVRFGPDVVESRSWAWVPGLDLAVTFRADGLSMVMLIVIGGVGVLVFGYAASYFEGSANAGKVAALLVGFAGAMTGLVMADNILLLFVFWELTSVSSFLLIGTEDRLPAARAAAQQALLITGSGGLAMLAGFVLLGQASGTWTLSGLVAQPPAGPLVTVGLVLVLVGALTKSAQVPFHSWLPAAMSAPTPVSAFLHSATMVKAGIYLVARLSPAFAEVGPWRAVVLSAGLGSLLIGGYRALRQHDLKLLLAFGTVSQLGLLLVLFGIGTEAAWTAGVVLLLAHAVFKAGLFMSVGVVDHATHTRDFRRLDRLGRRLPATVAIAVVAAGSMAGLPPLLGFVAKEEALGALLAPGSPGGMIVVVLVVVGSMLTVAYSARFAWGLLGPAQPAINRPATAVDHAPSVAFVLPAGVLAAVSIVAGIAPFVLAPLIEAATSWLGPGVHTTLALWHGLTPALGWSAAVIAGGGALFALRTRVERVQSRLPHVDGSQRFYDEAVKGVLRGADRITGVSQSGSLPVYLGVICLVTVAAGFPLVVGGSRPERLVWFDTPLQVVPAIVMIGAAIGCVVIGRRFAAVVMLGAAGYGMAAFFMIQGAPDLAITQLLIETLTVVAFVLVLRHLPDRFPRRFRSSATRRLQLLRMGIASLVGVFIFVFILASTAERSQVPVAQDYVERSLPDGGGRNVVNVIVVDFRGFDTLGEITVLVTAALGVGALVMAGRHRAGGATGSGPRAGPVPTPAGAVLDEERSHP